MYSFLHLCPLAILGLTVLAIGNSVGNWVADTTVARAGRPEMGVASCFGSPLLNIVLGLSVALIVSRREGGRWMKHSTSLSATLVDVDSLQTLLYSLVLGRAIIMDKCVRVGGLVWSAVYIILSVLWSLLWECMYLYVVNQTDLHRH